MLDRLVKEHVARSSSRTATTCARKRVRERTGAKVAIHPADAAYAREQGARIDARAARRRARGPLRDRGRAREIAGRGGALRRRAAPAPGGRRLVGNPPGRLSLLPERVMDDPARLRASLRELLGLDFDCVLVGDGVPLLAGGHDRLAELVAALPIARGIIERWRSPPTASGPRPQFSLAASIRRSRSARPARRYTAPRRSCSPAPRRPSAPSRSRSARSSRPRTRTSN